jgi:hypothetical protein
MKRIYHTWDKWECYKAGFYEEKPPKDFKWSGDVSELEECYRKFLSDLTLFEKHLKQVISKWKNSCEHYLTNENMNRIAWLGQASMCIYSGLPSKYRGGYNSLTDEQKEQADLMALKYLNMWLAKNGGEEIKSLDEATSKTQADLY